ncbi:Outer membrane protein MIP [Bienertia sinuspersici]
MKILGLTSSNFSDIATLLKQIGSHQNTSDEPIQVFPHGKAFNWLERLPPNSLTTWNQVTVAFLSKFIPLEKTTELRSKNANFEKSRMNLSTLHGRDSRI